MHINITPNETANNKGSSGQLVSYLEKENRVAEKLNQPEYWFNQENNNIRPYDVRYTIDNNVAKLSKDETKFFLVNISPSEKEISFLKEQYGEDGAKEQMKQYANQLMNDYALNFNRNNINSNNYLVYFGKLENHRYYGYKDEGVKNGNAKKGEQKPGQQLHIQIIVSRKDATNSIKLSPLNNSRGKNQTHSLKVGQFDRIAFKQSAERRFDKLFMYERELKETFKYANTLKNGDYEQRLEMKEKQKEVEVLKQKRKQPQRTLHETLFSKSSEKDMSNITEDSERKNNNKYSQGLVRN